MIFATSKPIGDRSFGARPSKSSERAQKEQQLIFPPLEVIEVFAFSIYKIKSFRFRGTAE